MERPDRAGGAPPRARVAALVTVLLVLAWLICSFVVFVSWSSRWFTASDERVDPTALFDCIRQQVEALPKAPTYIPLEQNGEQWYQRAHEFAVGEFPLVDDVRDADRLLVVGLTPGGPCNGWAVVTVPV